MRQIGSLDGGGGDRAADCPYAGGEMGRRLLIGLMLVITACGSPQGAVQHSTPPTASAAPPTPAAATPSPLAAPPTLAIAGSRYGQIVVDGSGRALYLFDAEAGPQPRCYGPCASAWPPYVTTGQPVAGAAVEGSLVGTATRSDGSRQVTYNGHPLYYYVGDHAPGEILCQAVFEYGGGWFVVDPQGAKITKT